MEQSDKEIYFMTSLKKTDITRFTLKMERKHTTRFNTTPCRAIISSFNYHRTWPPANVYARSRLKILYKLW